MSSTTDQHTRRAAIRDLGSAGIAIALFGSSCSSSAAPSSQRTSEAGPSTSDATSTTSPTSSTTVVELPLISWRRVEMSNVSAYVLVRGGEAAIVDTGEPGALADFERVLSEVGIGWADVGNIVVTHRHPDHAGGVDEMFVAAPDASVHVGREDLEAIEAFSGDAVPRIVDDGDSVFDLRVIATPGHTPGHISVLDERAGILVAGDALNNRSGLASASADRRFTADLQRADESAIKLSGFDFEIALFGHGDPLLENASNEVANLAATLDAG